MCEWWQTYTATHKQAKGRTTSAIRAVRIENKKNGIPKKHLAWNKAQTFRAKSDIKTTRAVAGSYHCWLRRVPQPCRLPEVALEATKASSGSYQSRLWRLPEPALEATRASSGSYQSQLWRLPEPALEATRAGSGRSKLLGIYTCFADVYCASNVH